MQHGVMIGPGRLAPLAGTGTKLDKRGGGSPLRSAAVAFAIVAAFSTVCGQLIRLAASGGGAFQINMSAPVATGFARPDLVDRNGRLLATDVEMQSLFADPLLVVDRDEVVEKLRRIFPDINGDELRRTLAERGRRFVWIKRGLSPALAQRVHNLGLPGLSFRPELRRAYPAGTLAGHLLGGVNIDNAAVAGVERYLDQNEIVDSVSGAVQTDRRPVALSLDIGVQHAVEDELAAAIETYRAKAAAGLVLDVETGEVVASASVPTVDPMHPEKTMDARHIDRLTGGTYELGSIFKLLTVAMALDSGQAAPESVYDVTKSLTAGRFEIKDAHGAGRPLSVAEIFVKSSNVGAGLLALEAGTQRQREFLEALGLLTPLRTEAGAVAEPMVPKRWDQIETITIAYGHGLAVAPLQFAAAAAALVNGGELIQPTFLKGGAGLKRGATSKHRAGGDGARRRVVSRETSARIAEMMRSNVAQQGGTGRRADAAGYRVGGKTGTAEIAAGGRYEPNAVIASFLGAFPMEKPRYLTLVMLFEPERTAASGGEITAGHTAAPVTRGIVERIAPMLGVMPLTTEPSR
ncbi:MAG: penicillin-binding protein 2 [Hyphomicrobiaceae bacterium]|nr:penicillin-binding protein 2 [Hyphomicrobiaceae bacterium]